MMNPSELVQENQIKRRFALFQVSPFSYKRNDKYAYKKGELQWKRSSNARLCRYVS